MQNVQENVELAPLTTFKIGGIARYLVDVRSEGEILEAIEWAKQHDLGFIILAGGSNVLLPDAGILDLVIRIKGDLWSLSEDTVDVWAGTNLLHLINTVGKSGLGGWENLSGIPGSVGGAVRGNAGAFGSEIKDFVVTVRALNKVTKEAKVFLNPDCDFSYRHSFFKDNRDWLITRTLIRLRQQDPNSCARLSNETIIERERRHLQNVRAAGSFFMNPVAPTDIRELFEKEKKVLSKNGRVPAGWLIEKSGMKGARVGGAIASLQHPNYLVNEQNATAADVLALAVKIKQAVKDSYGVLLKEEAEIIGN